MIDAHCHLHDKAYNKDRRQVIERALVAGVEFFLSSGTNLADSEEALKLAEEEPSVYFSVGLHPFEDVWVFRDIKESKKKSEEYFNRLKELALHPKALAFGEFGFDFSRDSSLEEEVRQERIFLRFMEMAEELNKPVILHLRSGRNKDAYTKALKILERFSVVCVSHCFLGTPTLARIFLEKTVNLSFSGILTYLKREDQLLKVAKEASLKAGFLLETDAPYLAPVPYRGQRNEPAYIKQLYILLADVLGIDFGELERRVKEKFLNIFNIKATKKPL